MRFIADFHTHSHFSIATSKQLTPAQLDFWARLKGIHVVGTGDCFHPGWLKEIKDNFEIADNGLLRLKPELRIPFGPQSTVFFMLTGEVSTIYKKAGKVRKIHSICVFPTFKAVEQVQSRLATIGNIEADGRPILRLDAKLLLEYVLHSASHAFIIPAHIWTPWFSVLGSKSGFDCFEDCYDELTHHIFAIETGLSSDPPMNRLCSFLDQFRLVSNSDAHSPEKLGREANIFDTELSYSGIYSALKEDKGFLGTIEFFPQEGKYYEDGHRNCHVHFNPLETRKHHGLCPNCGKPLTVGVLYRVTELADRSTVPLNQFHQSFQSITPLMEVLAQAAGLKSTSGKAVQKTYHSLISSLGPEFDILLVLPLDQIETYGGKHLAKGIERLRQGKVTINAGYDGVFGSVCVFEDKQIIKTN